MTDLHSRARLASDTAFVRLSQALKRYYQSGKPRTPHAKAVQDLWFQRDNAFRNSIARNPRLRNILKTRLEAVESQYDRLIEEGQYVSRIQEMVYGDNPLLSLLKKRT